MTIDDYSFYKATHPGYGSYWDRQQHLFLYYKRSSDRTGDVLPDYYETSHLSTIYFGLLPYQYDLVESISVLFDLQVSSEPSFPLLHVTKDDKVYFTTDLSIVPKSIEEPKPIGISVDLNELFGSVQNSQSCTSANQENTDNNKSLLDRRQQIESRRRYISQFRSLLVYCNRNTHNHRFYMFVQLFIQR